MRIALGAAVWLVLLSLLVRWIGWSPDNTRSPASLVLQYATRSSAEVRLELKPPCVIAVGDPIFPENAENVAAIGRVTKIESADGNQYDLAYADRIRAELYAGWQDSVGADSVADLAFSVHQTPRSMGWVIQTMLPREKRLELTAIIMEAVREHQPVIVNRIQPLLLKSLQLSGEVIRDDLRLAIEKRREQIARLAGRYQVEIVQQRLVPLFSEVIWPIVQEESWPVASTIGQDVWGELSLWRLTWRYLYDVSPLPQKNLTHQEFERLVRDRISPLVTRWMPEIYACQRKIFRRIAEHERVRETATGILTLLANDAELQSLVLEVLREVLTDNPRLASVWQEVWATDEARAAMDDMGQRLEPAITGIGEAMFGNPRTQITPEFSTVVRNRVLFKDERWLTVRPRQSGDPAPGADGRLDVLPGPQPLTAPFHIPARQRQ